MTLGDSEEEIVVRAIKRRGNTPSPERRRQVLVRRRPLPEMLAELRGVQKLYDELLAAGDLRHAAELCDEMERLTREYVARRDAPPVRPPVYVLRAARRPSGG
jgi:hypothetical protein